MKTILKIALISGVLITNGMGGTSADAQGRNTTTGLYEYDACCTLNAGMTNMGTVIVKNENKSIQIGNEQHIDNYGTICIENDGNLRGEGEATTNEPGETKTMLKTEPKGGMGWWWPCWIVNWRKFAEVYVNVQCGSGAEGTPDHTASDYLDDVLYYHAPIGGCGIICKKLTADESTEVDTDSPDIITVGGGLYRIVHDIAINGVKIFNKCDDLYKYITEPGDGIPSGDEDRSRNDANSCMLLVSPFGNMPIQLTATGSAQTIHCALANEEPSQWKATDGNVLWAFNNGTLPPNKVPCSLIVSGAVDFDGDNTKYTENTFTFSSATSTILTGKSFPQSDVDVVAKSEVTVGISAAEEPEDEVPAVNVIEAQQGGNEVIMPKKQIVTVDAEDVEKEKEALRDTVTYGPVAVTFGKTLTVKDSTFTIEEGSEFEAKGFDETIGGDRAILNLGIFDSVDNDDEE